MHRTAFVFACLLPKIQCLEIEQEIRTQSSAENSLATFLIATSPAVVSRVNSARANTQSLMVDTTHSKVSAGEDDEKRFLIGNTRNDVSILKCDTKQVLKQGLLETSGLPHVCVAGESNAGKSSLINHLLVKKNLAKASSVAGKTRGVDMLLVNDRIVVTDLPGLPSRDHQVAKHWHSSWRPLVFEYMRSCNNLLAMFYVHDVSWKSSAQVREFLLDVREKIDLPIILVLTKDDRIIECVRGDALDDAIATRDAEIKLRDKFMNRIRKSLDFDGVHLHYSVDNSLPSSRKARRQLLRYIESLVKAGSKDECSRMLDEIASKRMAKR